MGRLPETLYQNEIDILNSIVKMLTWKDRVHPICSAYGLLKYLKDNAPYKYKIKTVKIAFVLDNDVHMHKDIDWRAL